MYELGNSVREVDVEVTSEEVDVEVTSEELNVEVTLGNGMESGRRN